MTRRLAITLTQMGATENVEMELGIEELLSLVVHIGEDFFGQRLPYSAVIKPYLARWLTGYIRGKNGQR